ncbi:hypothetical protein SERLA73DRAFT_186587 [Serpula lacrymans var. lacrymans S7.3]|uniref:DUF3835 domain-containing protein n=2 Tax=Serpula lacrymans var. lacrymans TaxID=341189 RepID=F8Q7J0_SERL3|nr:uncharacterized protein SERLADRAFT_475715 [Serpula lacrymans var. lacrymans S7.9]EGN95528.1 hypothetical protein SERLA73DRAFT_186587 [Serpula lacrymans var. lacrymans S7.3]EGO21056.1 hypothetical protein SERLADRAFT_475715 [Serpula lacrymans var. lacrymans S7.9]
MEPDLIPLTSLSSLERDRIRAEQERLLDLLEEEETAASAVDDELQEEHRRNVLEKRKEDAKQETEKLKAAKEMQRKMGKALLKSLGEDTDKVTKPGKEAAVKAPLVGEESILSKPRKSVSFADTSPKDDEDVPDTIESVRIDEPQVDWGDITPARLRSANSNAIVTKSQMGKLPMKMQVVERHQASPAIEEEVDLDIDSDDESIPDSPVPVDSDDGNVIGSDREDGALGKDSDADEDEGSDIEPALEDEYDLDSARHQREIALDYYNKKNAIGKYATEAMVSHTHDEDEWDQPEVPLEATLAGPRPKPAMSRFKSDRLASSSAMRQPTLSTSLGSSVIPVASEKSLRGAVRTGKLVNEQLYGGEAGESGSEDENIKKVLELIKNGEVQNVGPDFSTGPSSTVEETNLPSSHANPTLPLSTHSKATPEIPSPPSIPSTKSKPSKFKLARSLTRNSYAEPSLPIEPAAPVLQADRPPPSKPLAQPSQPHGTDYIGGSSSRPERPPVVMSSVVKESSRSSDTRPLAGQNKQTKKMSRFMAERS